MQPVHSLYSLGQSTCRLLAVALGLLLIVSGQGCGKSGSAADLRTDAGPIELRLSTLMPIRKIYWKDGVLTKDPVELASTSNNLRTAGFILLDDQQAADAINGYRWKDLSEVWEPGIPVPEKSLAGGRWSQSRDYTARSKPEWVLGNFYLNKEKHLLYFELGNERK